MSFPTLEKVKLYYPNSWRRNIGNLASKEDKKFNWFLCSRRYEDTEGRPVIEISPGTRFYNEDTGISYILKSSAILIVVETNKGILKDTNPSISEGQISDLTIPKNYHGLTSRIECSSIEGESTSVESVVCPEVVFGFIPGILHPESKSSLIIRYAKSRNECLRSKIPSFPNVNQIEEMLKSKEESEVCKILYKDIEKVESV